MNTAKAFVPANISCLFGIEKGDTSQTTGSVGVGFTVTKGATVTLAKSDATEIWFNNKKINLPTVISVLSAILGSRTTPEFLHVTIHSDFPLGYGFGISGASALATAYALNDLLNLGKTKKELAMIAHVAEVENGTGLGDILNQHICGCLVKYKPSYLFEAEKLDLDQETIYVKTFGQLLTKDIITNGEKVKKINYAASCALQRISDLQRNQKIIPLFQLISISKEFALASGLLTNQQVIKTINNIENKGGHASMIMLGNGIFSNIPFLNSSTLTIC